MKSTSIFVIAMLLLVTTGIASAACTWCGSGSWPQCASNPASGCWGWENNQSCLKSGCSSSGCTAVCSGSSSSSSSGSCPSSVSCPSGISCGCYIYSGLGTNKKALTSAGGSQYMAASAMMETENMLANYTFCDGKSGDSCNGGVTKMNFYEARTAGCANTGSGYSTWATNMNNSRSTDVTCWNKDKSYWGSKYWAVHRNGASGNSNPNTQDIANFKAVNDWTNNNIGSHMTDDVRFWASLPAI
jgi:hypothetical protein